MQRQEIFAKRESEELKGQAPVRECGEENQVSQRNALLSLQSAKNILHNFYSHTQK